MILLISTLAFDTQIVFSFAESTYEATEGPS